ALLAVIGRRIALRVDRGHGCGERFAGPDEDRPTGILRFRIFRATRRRLDVRNPEIVGFHDEGIARPEHQVVGRAAVRQRNIVTGMQRDLADIRIDQRKQRLRIWTEAQTAGAVVRNAAARIGGDRARRAIVGNAHELPALAGRGGVALEGEIDRYIRVVGKRTDARTGIRVGPDGLQRIRRGGYAGRLRGDREGRGRVCTVGEAKTAWSESEVLVIAGFACAGAAAFGDALAVHVDVHG